MSGAMAARLALRGIRKEFPGTVANDDISLDVVPGEIHALLGQNGAGKSTLVKMVYGVLKPDAGTMVWDGAPVAIDSPNVARALGIGMVFQHFSLFESLTVAENISLALEGDEPLGRLADRVAEVGRRFGLVIDPRRHVHDLSVGERQRVEIVRCLMREPKLLIMDEPTSVLTPQETDVLFATLRKLAESGCSLLYISHKLGEIQALCTRATILRAGKVVASCDPRRESPRTMAELMIGGSFAEAHREPRPPKGGSRLEVTALSTATGAPFATEIRNASFTVHPGEIFGIAGVAGSGQAELLAALSGEAPVSEAAAIKIDGFAAGQLDAAKRRALGMAFVPEERLGRGAIPPMSLVENTVLTGYRARGLARGPWIDFGAARKEAARIIADFGVIARAPEAEAGSLSGGNLQKFIVGREIGQAPKLLIVAQPTWGVDAGAAARIHAALLALADAGAAILVVSQDLDELFQLCDRIAVLYHGRLSSATLASETDVQKIGLLMGGLFDAAETAHA
jgi:simple sugar transport system ATP-binding protein